MDSSVPNSQLDEKTGITDIASFLNDITCSQIDVLNNTGKNLYVTQYDNNVAGKTYLQLNNSLYHIEGIINANQIKVSNASDSSSITVQYRYYN